MHDLIKINRILESEPQHSRTIVGDEGHKNDEPFRDTPLTALSDQRTARLMPLTLF
jgi:hypothetical protein